MKLLLFSFLLYTILFSSVLVKAQDEVEVDDDNDDDDVFETTEVKELAVVSTSQKFTSSETGKYSYTYSFTTGKAALKGLKVTLKFPGTVLKEATTEIGSIKPSVAGDTLTLTISGPLSANKKFDTTFIIKTSGSFNLPTAVAVVSETVATETQDSVTQTEEFTFNNSESHTTTTAETATETEKATSSSTEGEGSETTTTTTTTTGAMCFILKSAKHSFTQEDSYVNYVLDLVTSSPSDILNINIPLSGIENIAVSNGFAAAFAKNVLTLQSKAPIPAAAIQITVRFTVSSPFHLPTKIAIIPIVNGKELPLETFKFNNRVVEASETRTTTTTKDQKDWGIKKVDHTFARQGNVITYTLAFVPNENLTEVIARLPVDTSKVVSVFSDKQTQLQIVNGEVDLLINNIGKPGKAQTMTVNFELEGDETEFKLPDRVAFLPTAKGNHEPQQAFKLPSRPSASKVFTQTIEEWTHTISSASEPSTKTVTTILGDVVTISTKTSKPVVQPKTTTTVETKPNKPAVQPKTTTTVTTTEIKPKKPVTTVKPNKPAVQPKPEIRPAVLPKPETKPVVESTTTTTTTVETKPAVKPAVQPAVQPKPIVKSTTTTTTVKTGNTNPDLTFTKTAQPEKSITSVTTTTTTTETTPATETKPVTETKPATDTKPTKKPGNNKPGNNKPGNNKPGNNKPGNNKPGNNKPGNNKPGNKSDNKPVKTTTNTSTTTKTQNTQSSEFTATTPQGVKSVKHEFTQNDDRVIYKLAVTPVEKLDQLIARIPLGIVDVANITVEPKEAIVRQNKGEIDVLLNKTIPAGTTVVLNINFDTKGVFHLPQLVNFIPAVKGNAENEQSFRFNNKFSKNKGGKDKKKPNKKPSGTQSKNSTKSLSHKVAFNNETSTYTLSITPKQDLDKLVISIPKGKNDNFTDTEVTTTEQVKKIFTDDSLDILVDQPLKAGKTVTITLKLSGSPRTLSITQFAGEKPLAAEKVQLSPGKGKKGPKGGNGRKGGKKPRGANYVSKVEQQFQQAEKEVVYTLAFKFNLAADKLAIKFPASFAPKSFSSEDAEVVVANNQIQLNYDKPIKSQQTVVIRVKFGTDGFQLPQSLTFTPTYKSQTRKEQTFVFSKAQTAQTSFSTDSTTTTKTTEGATKAAKSSFSTVEQTFESVDANTIKFTLDIVTSGEVDGFSTVIPFPGAEITSVKSESADYSAKLVGTNEVVLSSTKKFAAGQNIKITVSIVVKKITTFALPKVFSLQYKVEGKEQTQVFEFKESAGSEEAITTTTTTTTTKTTTTEPKETTTTETKTLLLQAAQSPDSGKSDNNSGLSTGAIIGIAVGGAAVLALIVVVVVVVALKKKSGSNAKVSPVYV